MRLNRLYDYKTVNRVTRPDGVRYYHCPDTGLMLPSVTTVLGATKDLTGLNEWRERVGDVAADRVRDDACALGTLMHTHIENHVLGETRPRGNNPIRVQAARMADQIIGKGLPLVDEVWGQEVALYMPGMYAGTTDLVGLYDGVPAIMDHKTSRKMKTHAQIEDYRAQLAAYAIAHDELFGTTMKLGVVFMVARDFSFRRFVLDEAELDREKINFLTRLQLYYDKHGTPQRAPTTIGHNGGPPIEVTA